MLLRKFSAVLALCLVGLTAPFSTQAKAEPLRPLLIFAASSLAGVLEPILAETSEGARTRVSYGGSGALARQIEAGAEVDLFISANQNWTEYLTRKKLADPSLAQDIISNQMVIARASRQGADEKLTIASLQAALAGGRLAMGDPAYVPAGSYGKQALEWYGVWEELKSKLVLTNSARGALALLARGEVPFALVYKTDAQAAGLEIAIIIAAQSHSPVIYRGLPIGRLHSSQPDRAERAEALLTELKSPKIQSKFQLLGFDPPS